MTRFFLMLSSFALFVMALLSLYLMIGASPFTRADAFSAQASIAQNQEQAARLVAQAIAINPYHMPFWTQLSYLAPKHRERSLFLSSNVSSRGMKNRFDAVRQLDDAMEGE